MVRRQLHHDDMRRLCVRALQGGAKHRIASDDAVFLSHLEWDVSAGCQSPVTVECYARPDGKGQRYVVVGPGRPTVMGVTMETKCRKCEACLRKRAAHWRLRCLTEYRQAPRSWLGTLTFRQDVYHAALNRARVEMGRQGYDYDALSERDRMDALNRLCGKHVTDWLKRLRKGGHKVRYFAVPELGETTSRLHYHVVLHEIMDPVPHRVLKSQWTVGFSDFKLISEERGATYAAKYLTKAYWARVRASIAYGVPRSPTIAEPLKGSACSVFAEAERDAPATSTRGEG